ncbi:MAG: ATP-binding protein [bacterium]|nr:PAS domain-containing protein [bacterium]MBU1918928.1 PAS domain-containing protein [bacterium]
MKKTQSDISQTDIQTIDELCIKVEELESLVETISRSKVMWETTFDVISDPVLIINRNYEIRRANKALAKACDLNIRDVIGKKCHEIFAGYQKPCPKCPVDDIATTQQPDYRELEMFPTQRQYTVNAYAVPSVFNEQDESIVLHYRDITDEKHLQKKLMQSEKMAAVGTLAGGVAHEINNPLGGILAFVQLVMRALEKEHACQDDLKEIEDAALRCKKIVRNLLDFSREKIDERMELVVLNEAISRTMALISVNAKQTGVEVVQDMEKDIASIVGDLNKLQQVVLNLVTNSIAAMQGGGGVLTLSTFMNPEKTKVFLQVSDTGKGIEEENMNRIFDPYFTTKKQGEGTGLGLAICYKIIEDHKGKIDIESVIDQGTTVTIHFPAVSGDRHT